MSFVKTNERHQQHWGDIEVGRLDTESFFCLDRNDYIFLQEIYSKYVTPLQPIAKEPQPYVSKHTVSQPLSPYYLSNNDSRKNFMSGILNSSILNFTSDQDQLMRLNRLTHVFQCMHFPI